MMFDTPFKQAVAKYIRARDKADAACYDSDGARPGVDRSVFDREENSIALLKTFFTDEEWAAIKSDDSVPILDEA